MFTRKKKKHKTQKVEKEAHEVENVFNRATELPTFKLFYNKDTRIQHVTIYIKEVTKDLYVNTYSGTYPCKCLHCLSFICIAMFRYMKDTK